MGALTKLPNIGKVLEEKLVAADITNAEQLIQKGAEKTFLLLSFDDPSACYNMLCALEGAIQGIRWHKLPKERKEELKAFLQMKKLI